MNTKYTRPGNESRACERHDWRAALAVPPARKPAQRPIIRYEIGPVADSAGVDHLRSAFRAATERFLDERCVLDVVDLLPEDRREYHGEILIPFRRLLASLERPG